MIDNDHRELFDRGAALEDLVRGRAPMSQLIIAFDALVERFRDHFGCEEGFLERAAYPGLAHHCEKHRGFLESLLSMRQILWVSPQSDELSGHLFYIKNWHTEHIMIEDRKYVAYLQGGA